MNDIESGGYLELLADVYFENQKLQPLVAEIILRLENEK
jgi:hypothetical protein